MIKTSELFIDEDRHDSQYFERTLGEQLLLDKKRGLITDPNPSKIGSMSMKEFLRQVDEEDKVVVVGLAGGVGSRLLKDTAGRVNKMTLQVGSQTLPDLTA